MSISFVQLRRIVFGTSCAVVLGFGATQALASPARASYGRCKGSQALECYNYCAALGAQGFCTSLGAAGYDCVCSGDDPEA